MKINKQKQISCNSVWDWFVMILLLVFIILKVAGVTMMSWWWVFSPIWIPSLIALIGVGLYYKRLL